ncbi:MAG TPA: hypothetical protein VMZ11_04975 [Mycobacteriales bacterium]|nr:hypothetical protein [Mycobacteriales bacterium]
MKRIVWAVLGCALAASCSHTKAPAASAALPTPTAATASPRPGVDPHRVPAGFRPVSATFVSDRAGWVLGTTPCPQQSEGCYLVAATRDGGTTWRALSRPPGTGVGELRFADARNGFLLAGALSTTHDGGRHWTVVDTLRDAIHEVWSAEAARGQLWLTGRVDHGGRGVWLGSVRGDSYDLAPVQLPDGDEADLGLALSGPGVAVTYLDGQAPRLVLSRDGDTFVTRELPCPATGPLALRSPVHGLLACRDGRAFLSRDGGLTWRHLTRPGTGVPLVTPSSLFVATTRAVLVSRDEGATWSSALTVGGCGHECAIRAAGFEGPAMGFVIEGGRDGARMLVSHDDGRTWHEAEFRRTG